MTIKTMAEWEASKQSLSEFLSIGDKVCEEITEYVIGVLPPFKKMGFLQMGEAYSHNSIGQTYITFYKGVYLGHLNSVYQFFDLVVSEKQRILKELNKPSKLVFNISYAKTTPESVEAGEFSETGMYEENLQLESFAELHDMVKLDGYMHPSNSNWQDSDDFSVSTESQIRCWVSGEEMFKTLIPNNPRSVRYLKKALSMNGIN